MSEHHEIIGQARGEPRAAGCVGVRVRVRLSGCPSPRWSQALAWIHRIVSVVPSDPDV